MDLVPDGAETEVTPLNVHNYVRKYAQHRMCTVAEKATKVWASSNIGNIMFRNIYKETKSRIPDTNHANLQIFISPFYNTTCKF